ncbi:MAG: glycoside hydrolase family 2 TIM barrel-domain containing protein [Verrucomicrobiota bacterium]
MISHICLFFLLTLTISASPVEAANAQFENLLVFAGRDQVRVSASFRADNEIGDLEFRGKITRASGEIIWEGPLGRAQTKPGTTLSISNLVSGLKPELWSPVSPTLYHLEVSAQRAGKLLATKKVRFGFRSFEIRNGQFHLNGQPVFLRGVAINPPGRGIPEKVAQSRKFAEDYVRFLKSQNLNIFRISTDESQVWFDVCDELGMMLYAGRYGSPPEVDNKKAPPKDFAKSINEYKKLFEGYASHPSIVEYYLSNELPYTGERGDAFSDFLTRAHAEMKKWDSTRPYIGNAGYGAGREGDVCDVHRYWGWYYNSFLTYYNLRDKLFAQPLFGDPQKNQPLTFSECVGSFTGSSGEFNVIRSKQLAPSLGWIGHTETPREDALAYQSFMAGQACESFRRMRPQNPRLAGLMPFTILFYNWSGISSFAQMKAKPVMDAMRTAYQPVLLSWELWTPQVYAGSEVRAIAHIINDDDQKRELRNATLDYRLRTKDGKETVAEKMSLPPIPYYGTWSKEILIKLPVDLSTGEYVLSGSVVVEAETRSTNSTKLFIAGDDWKKSAPRNEPFQLYDPQGRTAAALQKAGILFERISNLSSWPGTNKAFVIGERAWDDALTQHEEQLKRFVRDGGRVLCLQPDANSFSRDWLPQKISFFTSSPNDVNYPPLSRPFREQMNVNPERPDHAVFLGLNRRRLSLWSDYTGWNQTKPGFPSIYPVTAGFKLEDSKALATTAVLADYDRGLEGVALCEMFDGQGSVILSGFDLVNRAGFDPVADRLLANLVTYTASKSPHEIHPLIEKPIRWGDYKTERGVVCGSLNGLLVNAEWIPSPANPRGKSMPPNTGAWNSLPGEQFAPRGRNPFGPYSYTTASSLKDKAPEAKVGEGFFWARIPTGKKFVVSTVKNPTDTPSSFKVFVNDQPAPGSTATIAAGKSARVRTPLTAISTNVRIRYAGEKTLVLLETNFE